MIIRWVLVFLVVHSLPAQPLLEQFEQTGYVEITDTSQIEADFDSLYARFDKLIALVQSQPVWAQKLFMAKERFIRSKNRAIYSTDFFGLYDESAIASRSQIAFYYSVHFHEYLRTQYPQLINVTEIGRFLDACQELQKPCSPIFTEAATDLGIASIFAANDSQAPVLFKVIKYLPAHNASMPHYDGSAFSLFCHSTDNESLLLSPYKASFSSDDFTAVERNASNSQLLIPGALLTEFNLFPTPHIVVGSGKVRYAAIAFAMRSSYKSEKFPFTALPNFAH